MKRHKIVIRNGQIHYIYSDKLQCLAALGSPTVKRASHVEPIILGGLIKWQADMAPSGGPVLGPFDDREAALAAEVSWLEARLGHEKPRLINSEG